MGGETGHGIVLHQLWVARSKFKKKDKAHQWKVEEFLHTILLDQAITVRTINILAVLNNTLSLLKKNYEVTFLHGWS